MEDLTPLYNKEFYLAHLCGEDVVLPIPDGNTEHYLAYLCGMDVEIPDVPDGNNAHYLAYKCGQDVELPDPLYRIEFYLAKWCGVDVEVPEPLYRIEYWLAQLANSGELKTVTGNPISVSDALAKPAESLSIEILPYQSGSGDPSPDNVRPITGWTGVNVWDDPKYGGLIEWNQLAIKDDYTKTAYGLTITGSKTTGEITITGTSTGTGGYDFGRSTFNVPIPSGHKVFIRGATSKARFRLQGSYSYSNYNNVGKIITAGSGTVTDVVINMTLTTDEVVNETIRPQIIDLTEMFGEGNEPSTVEEFEALFPKDYYAYDIGTETTVSAVNGDPYRHYSIDWTDEAGTVYGGTLDVTTGVLTVNMVGVDMGSLTWTKEADPPLFRTTLNDMLFRSLPMCSMYKGVIATAASSIQNMQCASTNSQAVNLFRVRDENAYSMYDATGFKSYVSGQTLAYQLETPQTIQLTPTQVQMLLGNNVIWNDVNGDMTLEYLADGPADDVDALQILLGNRYVNNGEPDEATDKEALEILLGGR